MLADPGFPGALIPVPVLVEVDTMLAGLTVALFDVLLEIRDRNGAEIVAEFDEVARAGVARAVDVEAMLPLATVATLPVTCAVKLPALASLTPEIILAIFGFVKLGKGFTKEVAVVFV